MCGEGGNFFVDRRRAFTLLEVLVSMMILSVGILGVLRIFSMCVRANAHAANLEEAVRMAQNQLALATAASGQSLSPSQGTSGRYQWSLEYAQKSEGLVLALVTVQWTEQGQEQQFKLSQLFLPKQ